MDPRAASSGGATTRRYAAACLAVALATGLKLLATPLLEQNSPFLLYSAAIMVSALYGGIGPGLLAVACSGTVVAFLFLPPHYSFLIASSDLRVRLAVFVVEMLFISVVCGALRSAKHRLEASRAGLEAEAALRLRLLDRAEAGRRTAEALAQMATLVTQSLDPLDVQQSIDVRLEAGESPDVSGDAASLREVLVNLVLNAVDALPSGGRIVIKTWASAGRAHCSVTDTGVGMSAEVQRRAVDPFFTTKGMQNTGLGLSVNYGIIQRHGGELTIESAVGQGTTVAFWLPAAAQAPGAPDRGAESAPSVYRRILLIDDAAAVRQVMTEMLVEDGHLVIEAASGPEGLARLTAEPAVDLVLTDLGMPGMTGWEVARAINASHPTLPVGLVTGLGSHPHGAPEDRVAVAFVLAKPVMRDALRAKIRPVPKDRGPALRPAGRPAANGS